MWQAAGESGLLGIQFTYHVSWNLRSTFFFFHLNISEIGIHLKAVSQVQSRCRCHRLPMCDLDLAVLIVSTSNELVAGLGNYRLTHLQKDFTTVWLWNENLLYIQKGSLGGKSLRWLGTHFKEMLNHCCYWWKEDSVLWENRCTDGLKSKILWGSFRNTLTHLFCLRFPF